MIANRQAVSSQKNCSKFNICSGVLPIPLYIPLTSLLSPTMLLAIIGPSKFCDSFSITREEFDGIDLMTSSKLFVRDGGMAYDENNIVATPRINIQVGYSFIASLLGLTVL